jgi:hypothetical protein
MSTRSVFFASIALIGLSLSVGCKRESSAVAGSLKSWDRDQFQPGGGNVSAGARRTFHVTR